MEEIWKPLKGYEGLYEISNYGVVKSLKSSWKCGRNTARKKPYTIITQRIIDNSYPTVVLIKDGKHKTAFVHRLVALTFIDNPNNFPMVNHKDEDRTNNRADNLEWCNSKYNNNYGTKNTRLSLIRLGKPYRKAVLQYNRNWEYINEYDSVKSAHLAIGV